MAALMSLSQAAPRVASHQPALRTRRADRAAPRAAAPRPHALAATAAAAPRPQGVAQTPAARRSVACNATKKTFASFDAMIAESDVPVLVDFYATWCGPCQMLTPILGDVAGALGEQIRVVKIDTEKYPVLASKYQIAALPTIVLFKGGTPVDRIEGLPTAPQLIARVRSYL